MLQTSTLLLSSSAASSLFAGIGAGAGDVPENMDLKIFSCVLVLTGKFLIAV